MKSKWHRSSSPLCRHWETYKIRTIRAKEVARQIRALVALPGDRDLFPNIRVVQHTNTYNSSYRGSSALFAPLWLLTNDTYTQRDTFFFKSGCPIRLKWTLILSFHAALVDVHSVSKHKLPLQPIHLRQNFEKWNSVTISSLSLVLFCKGQYESQMLGNLEELLWHILTNPFIW